MSTHVTSRCKCGFSTLLWLSILLSRVIWSHSGGGKGSSTRPVMKTSKRRTLSSGTRRTICATTAATILKVFPHMLKAEKQSIAKRYQVGNPSAEANESPDSNQSSDTAATNHSPLRGKTAAANYAHSQRQSYNHVAACCTKPLTTADSNLCRVSTRVPSLVLMRRFVRRAHAHSHR